MNESPRTSALGSASDTSYRPVSVAAVVGLGVAVAYGLWLLIAAGIALRTGQPLLLPPATLLLPLGAALVSGIGWRQVQRSEGTRVGLRLAQWGLTLSLLVGLGYAAYYWLGYLAVRRQAQDFTLQWIEQVRRSGSNEVDRCAAFWNTIDPLQRDRTLDLNSPEVRQKLTDDPPALAALKEALRGRYFWADRGVRGAFPRFLEHEVVLLLQEGGAQVAIEPLGVRTWEYLGGTEGGYLVEQSYRLTTREGVFEVVLPVMGKDIERRHWQVMLNETNIRQARASAFGSLIHNLKGDSRRFAVDWAGKLAEGKIEEAFLDTLPSAQRMDLRLQGAEAIRARPAYATFLEAGVGSGQFTADRRQAVPDIEKEAQALFRRAAGHKGFPFRVPSMKTYPTSGWKLAAGELQFFHPFEGSLAERYHCQGHVVVATTDPALVTKLRAAEQSGTQAAETPQLGRQTSWRISAVVLDSAGTMAQPEEAARK